MHRQRFRILIGVLAAGALALAGCSAGSTTTTPASPGASVPGSGGSGSAPAPSGSAGGSDATLNVGFVAAPKSLDFTQEDGAAIPQALLYNVYEGLVRSDENGDIQPLLAESWEVSDDGTEYTFTLRSGVTFTSGAEFTAADAVFSIERVKSDWKVLKAKMDVVESAEAVDDTTLKVTLSKPSQAWLYDMTTRVGAMFSRTGVDNLATAAVGTGPFTVASYDPNATLVLERNPDYWGDPAPLKTVNLRYFQDANAMNNAQLSGSIDVISTLQAPETLTQFADAGQFQIIEGTTAGEVLLSFNNSKAPLDDPTVRQSIVSAIDRQGIMDTVWAGKGTQIGSHSVPTDPWYTDLTQTWPYDQAKAQELLAGNTFTLRLRVPNLPYATAAAPIIASQLQQVGITVQVDTLDFPDWVEQVLRQGDYDMSIVAHVEPRDLATIWGNPEYYTHYDNPEVQKLLADGDAGTEEERNAAYQQVTEILAQDAAGDWLWALPNLIVARTDVRGLAQNQVTESFDLTKVSRG